MVEDENKKNIRFAALCAGLLILLVMIIALASCGDARRDASKSGQRVDTSSAEVIAFPDGFSATSPISATVTGTAYIQIPPETAETHRSSMRLTIPRVNKNVC